MVEDFTSAQDRLVHSRASLVTQLGTHPYLPRDLADLGLGERQARTLHAEANRDGNQLWTDPAYAALRPKRGYRTDVVGIVPSSADGALTMMLEYGIYLRSTRFARQQLIDEIDYAGTDSDSKLQHVFPIEHRATFGSPDAVSKRLPGFGRIRKYLASHDWNGPADALILGEQIEFSLDLGYDGPGGIPGVRHVRLSDLQRAKTFKGVPGY
ncbi:hypothetical protein AXK58_14150 [Tsukamurella tyrosinosolvens]|nr:hypothetical protein AXK58_14150 [Tsukamurella tyrosinosolvens]